MVFPVFKYGCESWIIKKLSTEELMPLNCGAGETPESPMDNKETKPVNLKGDEPWVFTGKTDAEAEAPVFWSSDVNR